MSNIYDLSAFRRTRRLITVSPSERYQERLAVCDTFDGMDRMQLIQVVTHVLEVMNQRRLSPRELREARAVFQAMHNVAETHQMRETMASRILMVEALISGDNGDGPSSA